MSTSLSVLLFLLPACSQEKSGSSTTPDGDAGKVELAPPEDGIQIHIGPFEIAPYEESYHCRIQQLPNDEDLLVDAVAHLSSETIHHFNIWLLSTTPDEAMEGDCDDLWEETNMALSAPIYASQTPEFIGEMPPGVAYELYGGQWVLLEYHAINTTDEPLWTEGWFNAYAADDTVEHLANGLYGSNTSMALAPGESETYTQKCYVDEDIEIFVLGSHFHKYGTQFDIYLMDEEGVAGELVYSNDDWTSPELAFFTDDPISVPAGSGFEFRCSFENTGDEAVSYGYETSDEMCMMVGVYYPDDGFKVCSKNP